MLSAPAKNQLIPCDSKGFTRTHTGGTRVESLFCSSLNLRVFPECFSAVVWRVATQGQRGSLPSNKCVATSIKGITASNKKLLVTRA